MDAVITTSDYFVDIVELLDIFSEDANEPSETRDMGSCFTISPAHPCTCVWSRQPFVVILKLYRETQGAIHVIGNTCPEKVWRQKRISEELTIDKEFCGVNTASSSFWLSAGQFTLLDPSRNLIAFCFFDIRR